VFQCCVLHNIGCESDLPILLLGFLCILKPSFYGNKLNQEPNEYLPTAFITALGGKGLEKSKCTQLLGC